MAYTAYKTWTVGEILTAANMNAQVRDNGLLGPEALATADSEVWVATAANAGQMESGATLRTSIGVGIGTDVQAWDAFLDDIAALTDPGADRIAFWDDSAGDIVWLTIGSGLSITDTTLTATAAADTLQSVLEAFVEDGTKKCIYFMGGASETTHATAVEVGIGFKTVSADSGDDIKPSAVILGGWAASTNGAGQALIRSNPAMAMDQDWTIVCRVAWADPPTNAIGYIVGIGIGDISPTVNGTMGWRMAPGGYYIGFVDEGGTETTRDSGTAGGATERTLRIEISGGGTTVKFFFNDSQVGADVTTNIPTGTSLYLGAASQGGSAASPVTADFADLYAWRDV